MWLFLLAPFIIVIVGVSWVNLYDGRSIGGKIKKKPLQHHLDADPLASAFAWKKARRLEEHRLWDNEFYGTIRANEPDQLIVYNGNLVTISEADRLYFIEEEKRKRK